MNLVVEKTGLPRESRTVHRLHTNDGYTWRIVTLEAGNLLAQEFSLEFIIKAHMKQKIVMGLNAEFWQGNVNEASSGFLTSNTTFGCCKLKRVLFGINSFPVHF